MPSFNHVVFVGNATRDPQLKYLPSQTAVCEWGMAANRKFTVGEEQREEVTFVDVTAFGKLAEIVSKYVVKGKPVLVSGRLKYDQWEDKNGGGKRSKLSIIADSMQLLGSRDGGGDAPEQDRRAAADEPPGSAGGPPPTQRRMGGGGGQSKMFIGGGNRGPGLPDAARGRATAPPDDQFQEADIPFARFPNPLASQV